MSSSLTLNISENSLRVPDDKLICFTGYLLRFVDVQHKCNAEFADLVSKPRVPNRQEAVDILKSM